jgi:hypothetical protein
MGKLSVVSARPAARLRSSVTGLRPHHWKWQKSRLVQNKKRGNVIIREDSIAYETTGKISIFRKPNLFGKHISFLNFVFEKKLIFILVLQVSNRRSDNPQYPHTNQYPYNYPTRDLQRHRMFVASYQPGFSAGNEDNGESDWQNETI